MLMEFMKILEGFSPNPRPQYILKPKGPSDRGWYKGQNLQNQDEQCGVNSSMQWGMFRPLNGTNWPTFQQTHGFTQECYLFKTSLSYILTSQE